MASAYHVDIALLHELQVEACGGFVDGAAGAWVVFVAIDAFELDSFIVDIKHLATNLYFAEAGTVVEGLEGLTLATQVDEDVVEWIMSARHREELS